MTQQPSYRKVNPADSPVLFVALNSPAMTLQDLQAYAEQLISPTLSTISGVAQVNIFGARRYAVRVQVQTRCAGGPQHRSWTSCRRRCVRPTSTPRLARSKGRVRCSRCRPTGS